MIIDIDNRQDAVDLDVEELARLYRSCLETYGLERGELSVLLVDEAEMSRMNLEQMGVEGPTDVLSFPQIELHPAELERELERELEGIPADAELPLGDIVLCPAVILRQAPADPWSVQEAPELEPTEALVGKCPEPPGPESQFHLVAVHGFLHLMGHDHATLEQAGKMAEEQGRLLERVFDCTLLGEEDELEYEAAAEVASAGSGELADEADAVDAEAQDAEAEAGSAAEEAPAGSAAEEAPAGSAAEDGVLQIGEQPPGFRAGYVALVGRPNVGKSTLMNALIGAKVSITSHKPQTTRNRIVGIYTDARAQVLFIDTPGLHEARDAFNRRLVAATLQSLEEADLVCYMIEPPAEIGPQERYALQTLAEVTTPKLLLINKVDSVPKGSVLPIIARFQERDRWEEVFPISALDGTNLGPLMEAIISRLPEGPVQYPGDQLTDQTERFIVAETVREKLMEQTHQEVPYATAVEVVNWEETPALLKLGVQIHVERPNQKGIVIGRGGEVLKRVGTAARRDLEKFFDCKIYLELHVTVSDRWRESEAFLRSQNL